MVKIPLRGRGAQSNPTNRFERVSIELDPVEVPLEDGESAPLLRTQYFKDHSRSLLSENSSPDVGFKYSINPYRGCEHGCIYCYARPSHEYLGFSAGTDFESKIMVKEDAPELLRKELSKPSWQPQVVLMSGNTDCYQPIERKLQLTRRCLQVFSEFLNPVSLITKNSLIVRDLDVLETLASVQAAEVTISITTLDEGLAAKLEPRTSRPKARLEAVRELASAQIPVKVNIAPVIPGLNCHEIPKIVEAATQAGANSAEYIAVRLPGAIAPLFAEWLEVHYPLRKDKVLSAISEMRGERTFGVERDRKEQRLKLNDSQFGSRMRGVGAVAENLRQMFEISCRRYGLDKARRPPLSVESFRRVEPKTNQLSLF